LLHLLTAPSQPLSSFSGPFHRPFSLNGSLHFVHNPLLLFIFYILYLISLAFISPLSALSPSWALQLGLGPRPCAAVIRPLAGDFMGLEMGKERAEAYGRRSLREISGFLSFHFPLASHSRDFYRINPQS